MSLGAHNGLGDPEIPLFQAPDVVQAEGDLIGRQRLRLAAPYGVVVVGGYIQMLGHSGVIRMLAQSPAREIVDLHHAGNDLPEQPGLKGGKLHNALTAESLPVQPKSRVVGGDGSGRQRDLAKIVVRLGPKHRAVGIVERSDVPVELLLQIGLEGIPALRAPADVAVLMAEFVVDLPGHDGLLALVMLCHRPDDALCVPVQRGTIEAVHMPSAEDPFGSILKFREDVRVLFGKPGRNGGRGGAHDNGQSPDFGPLNHMVEKGEVVLPLCRLHEVPAEFRNADGIAPQFTDIVQILLQQGGIPLLGIVVYAKIH